MEDNLKLFNEVANVPKEAQKQIQAGRLRGMTDINPMWRIKVLTEKFGPVGFGWHYKITRQWIEEGANGEKCAFVDVELYYKLNGEWSQPIEGSGGSSFVAKESKGLYTSDEAFKMALTDALSVACKAIGIGASIYWNGATKYTKPSQEQAAKEKPQAKPKAQQVQQALSAENGDLLNRSIKYVCETTGKTIKEITQEIEKFTHKPIKQLQNKDVEGVMSLLNDMALSEYIEEE